LTDPNPDHAADKGLEFGYPEIANLRGITIRQTGVTLGGQVVGATLQLISTVVLARLLLPRDFGLIAMIAVVVAFVTLLREVGLTQAVIQEKKLAHEQLNALFWFNAAVTFGIAATLAVAAPLVAGFFGEPDLVSLTLAFSAVLVVTGVGAVHQALLTRRMQFGLLVKLEVLSHVLGVAIAIWLALLGASYWALFALPAVRAVGLTALIWFADPWRPGAPRRGAEIGDMMKFGFNVTGFNMSNFFARNADNLLVGWRWGPDLLGYYSRAYSIMMLPLNQISAPLSRVAIPALTRLRDDAERYRRVYLRMVSVLSALASPLLAFTIVTADWIVELLLGPGWNEAAPILSWLAVAALPQPLGNATGWLFLTQDRSAEFLRWGIASSSLAVLSFAIGLPFGPVGVAAAYAISGLTVRTPLLLWWAGRRGAVSTRDLAATLGLPVLISVWAVASTRLLRSVFVHLEGWIGLLVAFTVLVGGYWLICRATSNGRQHLVDLQTILADLKESRRAS
jgi:PST family polysaccharide transporter